MAQCTKNGTQRKDLDEDQFRLNVCFTPPPQLICLAFVLEEDVVRFKQLRKEGLSGPFQQICDISRSCIGLEQDSRRVEPKFAVVDWNVYKRVLRDEYQTNHAVVG